MKGKSKGKAEVEEKTTRADLPQLLETDYEDRDQAIELIEKGWRLKQEKERIEGEYDEIKEDLSVLQKMSGLEGLRHNNLAFIVSHREGRVSFDLEKVKQALAEYMSAEDIQSCFKAGEKQGEGFYVRELVDLDKPRKGGRS